MTTKRWAIGGLSSVAGVLVAAATAWACVSGPSVTLSTVNAKPGQEIAVTASGFSASRGDLHVRMDALDGPVITKMKSTGGAFVVPANAAPGNHVLIFTQHDASGALTQMPVRSLLTVVPANGTNPVLGASLSPAEERPVGLVSSDDSISGGSLVLIGLGVAGVGMFVAGMAALFAGRRGSAPEAARARS